MVLSSVERNVDSTNRRAREARSNARDIAPIPDVVDLERRQSCRLDLALFCKTYFPEDFVLPWSVDHLKVISKIESAVTRGGLFSFAMPRASGKTTLCETAALWAIIYGHRRFLVFIGASAEDAKESLSNLKARVAHSELLMEDFPRVCYPVEQLKGIAHRANGQTYLGERTLINWSAETCVFPTIEGSECSGSCVEVAGITGRIRGRKRSLGDKSMRPDFVIIDDPQTDESAASDSQCRKRLAILNGAVLGLAGPGVKISGFLPCTVISKDDMADQVLDREQNSEWQGERMKMVYRWPDNEEMWTRYGDIRREEFANDGDGSESREYYAANREAMDLGAEVAWPERKLEEDISAIQHAWNLRIRDEEAFMSEYQNEPMELEEQKPPLEVPAILAKQHGLGRHEIPIEAEILTGMIDIQKHCLFWCVCAWEPNYTGYVVDYGVFPEQPSRIWKYTSINKTLANLPGYAGLSLEERLYAGVRHVCEQLAGKSWIREDGDTLEMKPLLVDANWGQSTNVVYRYARDSGICIPSHGRGIVAAGLPLNSHKRKPGEKRGDNWNMPAKTGKARHIIYDTNHWKSFLVERMRTQLGGTGCLSLWQEDQKRHELFAMHLTSEYSILTSGRGREVEQWTQLPDRPDNHWLDCLVGCAVGANMGGAKLLKEVTEHERHGNGKKRKAVTYY